jgi:diguanylate cyclase (GGDEF)-like protein
MITLRTGPARPVATSGRDACLVHIYPAGPTMGQRYPLAGSALTVGRESDCDLCVKENSISRRHARLFPGSDGYYVEDLQSTNGTFVNDVPVSTARLRDGDYLRIGNCIYRFLAGGNVEAEYHDIIYRLTIIDALTETHNKRYFLEFLDRELVRSGRYQRPLSLVLFDIDHFKKINDELGHLGGDAVLRELAARVRPVVRTEELFARYGGEEFALVLPETAQEGAVVVAERLRREVADTPFTVEDAAQPVTVSLGVATTCGEEGLTVDQLIQRADQKLYEAKRGGRNRVVS